MDLEDTATDTDISEFIVSSCNCPVKIAIDEIRAGGFFVDETDDSEVVKIGGVEFVCDTTSFYVTQRKIDLARFELSKPTLAACEDKFESMFTAMSAVDLCQHILDIVLRDGYLTKQFTRVIDLIDNMGQLIKAKIAMATDNINLSIPYTVPTVPTDYHHAALTDATNTIIDYMNQLDLNALLREPISTPISCVGKFDAVTPEISELHRITFKNKTPADCIVAMHTRMNQELTVAKYVMQIEAYHCKIINKLEEVIVQCQKIVDALR